MLDAIYYTDPLCSWSWAMEPAWRRLRMECGDRLRCFYRMGGMIAGWDRYQDPLNDVENPGQMAPQWLQVQEATGVPLDPRVWHENPPTSSYPACIAFEAAAAMNATFADRYLRRLREAVFLERRDVSQRNVLAELAREVNEESDAAGRIDVDTFTTELDGKPAKEAFLEDLRDCRFRGITRFPTLVFRRPDGTGIGLTGYRPYPVLRRALERVAPGLPPETALGPDDLEPYVARWAGRVTAHELAENFALTTAAAEQRLAERDSAGAVTG